MSDNQIEVQIINASKTLAYKILGSVGVISIILFILSFLLPGFGIFSIVIPIVFFFIAFFFIMLFITIKPSYCDLYDSSLEVQKSFHPHFQIYWTEIEKIRIWQQKWKMPGMKREFFLYNIDFIKGNTKKELNLWGFRKKKQLEIILLIQSYAEKKKIDFYEDEQVQYVDWAEMQINDMKRYTDSDEYCTSASQLRKKLESQEIEWIDIKEEENENKKEEIEDKPKTRGLVYGSKREKDSFDDPFILIIDSFKLAFIITSVIILSPMIIGIVLYLITFNFGFLMMIMFSLMFLIIIFVMIPMLKDRIFSISDNWIKCSVPRSLDFKIKWSVIEKVELTHIFYRFQGKRDYYKIIFYFKDDKKSLILTKGLFHKEKLNEIINNFSEACYKMNKAFIDKGTIEKGDRTKAMMEFVQQKMEYSQKRYKRKREEKKEQSNSWIN